MRTGQKLMSDCYFCPVESECHYPFKPCECVHQRKFWSEKRHAEYLERKTAEAIEEAKQRISASIRRAFSE